MADQNVKIIVSAEDKASADLKKVNSEIGKTGDAAKTTSQKLQNYWTELNQGFTFIKQAVSGAYQALEKVYNFAKDGAELDFTASKFDNLTESINTTSEALLRDLRQASDGTLSDMELMASATDFLSLGLANSHDEVVRLSTVASQLGMNMNQLVLTLTNQTTMRFDALGVSVAGFDDKVKALKDSGMDASAAFNEAFLQQAEEQIERVGSATDETIGTFMRFEASIGNLGTKIKQDFAPQTEGIIETLTQGINVLGGSSGWIELLYDVDKAVARGALSYEEYIAAINKNIESTGLLVDEQGKLNITTFEGSIKYMTASKEIDILTEAEYNAMLATQLWKADTDAITEAFGEQTTAIDEVKDATNNANEAMKKYSETLLFNIASQGLSQEEALALANAMGLVDQATVFATEKTSIYKQMLDDGAISVETYYALVEGLRRSLEGIPPDVNVDLWLKIHGYDDFQRVSNAIGSMGGSSGQGGGAKPIMQAAGGPVRPGQTVIVGESGPEILQMGQNGGHIYPTNVTNHFNLGVTTLQNANSIQTAFAIMQAMA